MARRAPPVPTEPKMNVLSRAVTAEPAGGWTTLMTRGPLARGMAGMETGWRLGLTWPEAAGAKAKSAARSVPAGPIDGVLI